jgi:hypothetical protein
MFNILPLRAKLGYHKNEIFLVFYVYWDLKNSYIFYYEFLNIPTSITISDYLIFTPSIFFTKCHYIK